MCFGFVSATDKVLAKKSVGLFVGALKGIAPLLVFVLVISSLANATGNIGKRFTTVITLYMSSTLIAAIIAVIASFIFPIEIKLATDSIDAAPPAGLVDIFKSILDSIVQNPVSAIAGANYVGILAWAVMLGLALKTFATQHLKESLQNISDAVSQVVRWIIGLAPFGILGLVFTAVSTSGLSIFADYGKLVLLLVGTMAFVTFVSNPVIVGLTLRRNPYPLVLKCLRESGITAFFNYSFDGAKNVVIRNARMLTKDAFWNTENVTVYDSFISGEYLGWNAKNLTLVNCTIQSLQGMNYVEGLKLVNCKLVDTTLAFEYATVEAEVTSKIDSVLNPISGAIKTPAIGELILEQDFIDPAKTEIDCPAVDQTSEHPEWRR